MQAPEVIRVIEMRARDFESHVRERAHTHTHAHIHIASIPWSEPAGPAARKYTLCVCVCACVCMCVYVIEERFGNKLLRV